MLDKLKEKLGKIIIDSCDLLKSYLLFKIGLTDEATKSFTKIDSTESFLKEDK